MDISETAEGSARPAPTTTEEGLPGAAAEGGASAGGSGHVLRAMDLLAEGVVAVALLGELALLFGNMLARELLGGGISWSQEIAEVALSTAAFVGGALAYRKGVHLAFDVLRSRLPASAATAVSALIDFLVALAACLVGVLALRMLGPSWSAHTPMLGMPSTAYLIPLPIGMALLASYAVARLSTYRSRLAWRTVAVAAAVVLVIGGLAWSGARVYSGWALGFALLLGVGLLVVGLPVGFVFVFTALGYLTLSGAAPVEQVSINVGYGVASFVLLPIPFFVLAGYLMTEGGLSRRIVALARAVVGGLPGGLLQVCVLSSFVFSGLTGAKTADVAAVGSTMNEEMRRHGYDPAETAAVLASAAAMGEMVPPSTAMLVLGSVSTVSIGALFVAGVLPAIITALLLMVAVYLRARKRPGTELADRPPGGRWAELAKAVVAGIPALAVPVILLGGVLSGAATPTESSALAVVYAIVVVAITKRGATWSVLRTVLRRTATMAGMVLLVVSTATAVSWCVTVAGIPSALLGLVHSIGGGPLVFLLISLVALVILGAVLEGLPAIILLGPLFMPVAASLGINTLQYGVFMVAAMGIGTFLPPVGVGAYIACAVCDVPMERMVRPYLSYTGALTLGVLLVGFVPAVSLTLPHWFGG